MQPSRRDKHPSRGNRIRIGRHIGRVAAAKFEGHLQEAFTQQRIGSALGGDPRDGCATGNRTSEDDVVDGGLKNDAV